MTGGSVPDADLAGLGAAFSDLSVWRYYAAKAAREGH